MSKKGRKKLSTELVLRDYQTGVYFGVSNPTKKKNEREKLEYGVY